MDVPRRRRVSVHGSTQKKPQSKTKNRASPITYLAATKLSVLQPKVRVFENFWTNNMQILAHKGCV